MTSSEEHERDQEQINLEDAGGTWTVISTDNGDKPESDK